MKLHLNCQVTATESKDVMVDTGKTWVWIVMFYLPFVLSCMGTSSEEQR